MPSVTPDTPIELTVTQMLVSLGAVIVAVASAVWWFSSQFQGLKDSIGAVAVDTQAVKGWLSSLLISLEGKINKKHLADLAKRLDLKAEAAGNPISVEEAVKINGYLEMVMKQKDFSAAEANEFKRLVELYVADEGIKKTNEQGKLDVLLGIANRIYGASLLSNRTVDSGAALRLAKSRGRR